MIVDVPFSVSWGFKTHFKTKSKPTRAAWDRPPSPWSEKAIEETTSEIRKECTGHSYFHSGRIRLSAPRCRVT